MNEKIRAPIMAPIMQFEGKNIETTVAKNK